LIGIPLILAGLLAGPTHAATHLRRLMAPYLRDRPDITFGAVALLLLLLFAWGPIVATKTLTGILIIIVLAVFGAEMLRRQTAGEFPEAHTKAFLASTAPGGPGPAGPGSPDLGSTSATPPEQPTHEDPGPGP
jgi:hypothetical protein